jgi:putative toxin-antitoxin system antitoxin component (TIGR02293 family)
MSHQQSIGSNHPTFSLLGVNSPNEILQAQAVASIRQGLPVEAAIRLSQRFGISEPTLARLMGISPRTFSRHKQHRQALPLVSSDRLYRLARVIALAEDVLEGEESTRKWLHRPNRALGGVVPLDLLDTDAGVEQLTDLLHRIEFGVYS